MTQMINTNENKVSNIANVYFLDYDKIHHNQLNDEIYGTTEDISQIKRILCYDPGIRFYKMEKDYSDIYNLAITSI